MIFLLSRAKLNPKYKQSQVLGRMEDTDLHLYGIVL
jgi:hypothetical protein